MFDYFITDSNGDATLNFEADSSYHVLWKNATQRIHTVDDGPLKTATFDPDPSEEAYDTDYPSSTTTIFGEWERLPIGDVKLSTGKYNCSIILTEESFHGSGDSGLSGDWVSVMGVTICFTIVPSQVVPETPLGTITTLLLMFSAVTLFKKVRKPRLSSQFPHNLARAHRFSSPID